MEPLRNNLNLPFQSKPQRRLVAISQQDIAAKTWECKKGEMGTYRGITFERQGCGVLEARVALGRVIKRTCPCEEAAWHAREQQEVRDAWLAQQVEQTYGWLGSRWADKSLVSKTFTNFEQQRQRLAYEAVLAYAETLAGTLVLHGTFGTGKTHLLSALCNYLRTRATNPSGSQFVTAPKLFNAIQERIGGHESYSRLIAQAIHTPLLVIDDIDKAKHTDFREEIYFEIIDERTKEGRPIAISTNRLDDLAFFVGGACASRLSIGQMEIEMTGEDYRREL